mgnify:CR=1 FL=1
MHRGFTESNFYSKCVIVKTPPGRDLPRTSKPTMAVITVKALPQTRIAGYLMPVRESAAVSVDYSKFTVKELKAMARGKGIKSWGKLRKAELVAALYTV